MHEVICCLHDYIFVPIVQYLLMVQSVLVVQLDCSGVTMLYNVLNS